MGFSLFFGFVAVYVLGSLGFCWLSRGSVVVQGLRVVLGFFNMMEVFVLYVSVLSSDS